MRFKKVYGYYFHDCNYEINNYHCFGISKILHLRHGYMFAWDLNIVKPIYYTCLRVTGRKNIQTGLKSFCQTGMILDLQTQIQFQIRLSYIVTSVLEQHIYSQKQCSKKNYLAWHQGE